MNEQAQLARLAEQVSREDVVTGGGFCLARRLDDDSLILLWNRSLQQEGDERVGRTVVFTPDGTPQEYISLRWPVNDYGQKVEPPPPIPFRVPVNDKTYLAFYRLWADLGLDDAERSYRHALVSANQLAMGLSDIDGS